MSDPHKEEKKDEKKDEKKAAAPAGPKTGIKALLGPILAIVVLVGAGIGIGMFLSSLITPPPTKPAGEGEGDAHGGAHGEAAGAEGGHGEGKEGEHGAHSLVHAYKEMVLDSVIANVKETGGKKFVKMNPVFWISPEAHLAAGLGGGGGHGGGGEAGGEIKRILRARLEENLRTYDLDELTGQKVTPKIEKAFRDIVEKEMHAVFPELKNDHVVVQRVVIQGMMVQ
jgi:hypothetical protein